MDLTVSLYYLLLTYFINIFYLPKHLCGGYFTIGFRLQKTPYALEKNTNEKIHVTFSQKPCQKRGNYDQQSNLKQKLLNQRFESSPKALFKMPVPIVTNTQVP